MFLAVWGRITGADQGKEYPIQQASSLGRSSDDIIVFPYGYYANLPNDAPLRRIGKGLSLSVTKDRPSDLERAEPVFFHPATNTRIIPRNNGDLDIDTVDASGNVNINTVKANVTASDSINLTAPLTKVTGDFEVTGSTTLGATVTSDGKNISDTHAHSQGLDSGGNTQVNTDGVI